MVEATAARNSAVKQQGSIKTPRLWAFLAGAKERYFNPEANGKDKNGKKAALLERTLEHDEYFGQNGILGGILSAPFGGRANKFTEDYIKAKHEDHLAGFKAAENKAAYIKENFSEEVQGEMNDHVAGSRLSGKINFWASLFTTIPQLASSSGPASFTSNLINILMNSFGFTRLFAMLTAMLPPGIAPVADTLLNLFGWQFINNIYDSIFGNLARGMDSSMGFGRQQQADFNNPQMAAANMNSQQYGFDNYSSQNSMKGGGYLSALA